MILKIARMGHPVLGGTAAPVADPRTPEIRRLVNDMVETMMDANGAGLAAPQVHVPLRIVVFQAPGERSDPGLSEAERFDHTAPLTVLINPEIADSVPRNRRRLGRLPFGAGPARLGRAARPISAIAGSPPTARPLRARRAAFMPGWCNMKWIIWMGGFIPAGWAICPN